MRGKESRKEYEGRNVKEARKEERGMKEGRKKRALLAAPVSSCLKR